MDLANTSTNDYIIPDPIDDTLQTIKFSQNKQAMNILASGGWDSKLRLWEINYSVSGTNAQFNSKLVYNNSLSEPILSLCWQPDSVNLFSGTTDGTICCNDLSNFSSTPIGKHELGVKELCWIGNLNLLISGGWDGKISVWDLKSNNPIATYETGKKIYTMSCVFPLLVVGLSDRQLLYFNFNKIQQNGFKPEAIFESHLKYQTRTVSVFSEGNGYAIGSIEGRVAIKYLDLNKLPDINQETKQINSPEDFAFRCHRIGDQMADVFPVNAIAFNHAYGTFCTGGGDGTWLIWDKESKSRLKLGNFPIQNQIKIPITALDYNLSGDLLAYAGGYDWSKGISGEKSFNPQLGIHYCPDSDKKRKGRK